MRSLLCHFIFSATIMAAASSLCAARTLCVNPGGTSGCYSSITAAVAAAAEHDTIKVAHGTYAEDVVIQKPLSVIGENRETTAIDATGLANGFYVDGIDHSGLREVVIHGFTVKNANFEGILVTNSAYVTIWGNKITANDKSLNSSNLTCPGIPSFETAEGFDCGEGIHLSGVNHSTVSRNEVVRNAGGILLSDDTGATHHIRGG